MKKATLCAFLILSFCISAPAYADDAVASIKCGTIKAQSKSNNFDYEGGTAGRYYYVTAHKDQQMVVMDFTATSKEKDAALPGLYVAKMDGDKPSGVEVFEVRFKKWKQYGCYIGLYHDDENDFATSDSVKFTAFSAVPKDGGEYVVFTDEARCYVRQDMKRKHPPVEYLPMGNCAFKPPTSLDGMKVLGKVRTAKR